MSVFRFRLEKVLEWRRTQLELEEANYRRHVAILAELDRRRAQLGRDQDAAERQVRAWNPVEGEDLEALEEFRGYIRRREVEMTIPRREAARRVEAQRTVMLEARRRLRLLERLRERRLSEWVAQRDKEIEATAAESFLARWNGPARGAPNGCPYNEGHDA